jgi:hypothetical protein
VVRPRCAPLLGGRASPRRVPLAELTFPDLPHLVSDNRGLRRDGRAAKRCRHGPQNLGRYPDSLPATPRPAQPGRQPFD